MFDSIRYLRENHIQYFTEGKNVSPGWVNVRCPMPRCGDRSNHGGFSPDGNYICWKCGKHDLEYVIMALERCEYHEACSRVQDYETDQGYLPVLKQKSKAIGLDGKLEWPTGTLPLQPQHKKYLASRGFDPDHLEARYGLRGTGPAGSYAWRIIAPIFYNEQMVSYQGRDITGKASIKYFACKPELELMSHKNLLYNIDNAGDVGILVEGVFDVWRLGDGAVAAIGTTVTKQQVIMAAERFKKVFLLFDSEKPAQVKAKRMADMLSVLGVEAVNVELGQGDPADLSQEEANNLKKELIR